MLKDDGAFLTIGELARELGVAQHILRYWESRFPQLRPLQRSGNRRYYRPADVEIARRINRLLNTEGYTVQGAQRLLGGRKVSQPEAGTLGDTFESAASSVPENEAVSRQPELPIGDLPTLAPIARSRPTGQVASTDMAVLIARLMVIRQNLDEALHAG